MGARSPLPNRRTEVRFEVELGTLSRDSRDIHQSEWARVNVLFHRALELEPALRADFVRRQCAGADAIGTEVLSLLKAHDRASRFLCTPAVLVLWRSNADV
jgi:hypothetical protein